MVQSWWSRSQLSGRTEVRSRPRRGVSALCTVLQPETSPLGISTLREMEGTMSTALLTGGTTGIGRATAELLLDRGYQVAVTGRDQATVDRARSELPGDALVVRSDARSLAETDALVGAVKDRFGTLDLLFLNAGVFRPAPIADVTEESFDDQASINLKGQFFTLQKMLPLLVDGGSVVLTVGVGSRRGSVGAAVSAGTRGALLAMLPSLAIELAPRRIRVNAVSPGPTTTALMDKLGATASDRDAMAQGIPLGRLGTADDVARTVAFLASEESRHITGQDIAVAGGYGIGA